MAFCAAATSPKRLLTASSFFAPVRSSWDTDHTEGSINRRMADMVSSNASRPMDSMPSSRSADTPSVAQSEGRRLKSGAASPVSHFDTAWALTPTSLPSSSCVRPCALRRSLILSPKVCRFNNVEPLLVDYSRIS